MLTSFFQREQSVNGLFFMHVWMFSLRVDFKLPASFCIGGKRQIFFFFSPTGPTPCTPRGEGERDREEVLTWIFPGLYWGQKFWLVGLNTGTELLSWVCPAQSCFVWVQLWKSQNGCCGTDGARTNELGTWLSDFLNRKMLKVISLELSFFYYF